MKLVNKLTLMALLALTAVLNACHHTHTAVTPLPYFNSPDFTPLWPTDSDAIKHMHVIPQFRLTNQHGRVVNNQTASGKICVADFFFTRCGSICPIMTGNMAMLADSFKNDARVLLLSHSVTPEYDNVATLQQYAQTRHITNPNWHLLTGPRAAIYALARKGYFAEDTLGYNRNVDAFLHTENFVLVDAKGHIRGVYNGTLQVEVLNLVRHIKQLEAEDKKFASTN